MGNRRLLLLGAVALLLAGLFYWDRQSNDDGVIRAVRPGSAPDVPSSSGNSPATAEALSGLGIDDALLPPLTGNPLAGLKLAELQATRKRPLFTPSRKAPRPAPAASEATTATGSAPSDTSIEQPAQKEEAKAGQFVLMGVVRGDKERLALLRHKATGELLRLREGDVFDGWSIDALESDRVHLSKGALQEVIVLFQEDESG